MVVLLAFALRIHRLAYDSIWWDEGHTVWLSRPPAQIGMYRTANDNHPPLYFTLMHTWMQVAGEEEYVLRLPSVLAGILAVAVAYQIGREAAGPQMGRAVGLAGALIMATSRLPVWWSQEARSYTIAGLAAAIAIWAALRLFRGREPVWLYAAIVAASTGGGLLLVYIYAGPVVLINLAAGAAFLLAGQRRWRVALAWAASQAGALLLFLPWVLYAMQYTPTWETPQEPVTFAHTVKLYIDSALLGLTVDLDRYLPLAAAGIVAVLCSGLSPAGRPPRGRTQWMQVSGWITLLIFAVLTPVLVYLVSVPRGRFNYPIPSARYFVPFATPLYVLIGWGMGALYRVSKPLGAVLLAALLAINGWTLITYYPGLRLADDYQSMAATLEALRQPGDAVILNNDTDWPLFDYHYDHEYSRHITRHQTIGDWKYADDLLRDFRINNEGVWLVQTRYAEQTDPRNELGQWLEFRSWYTQHYVFPEGQLWFYAMKPERSTVFYAEQVQQWPALFRPVENAPIAEGVRLAGYTRAVPEVFAGDLMVVGLGWQVDPAVQGEWPVALKLIGPDGTEITSRPVTLNALNPQGERRFLPVEIFVPPGTPAGRAQIVFVAGETWVPLDTVRIRARNIEPLQQAEIPETAVPLNIRFGESITLVAVDLPDQMTWEPGDNLPLVLYWRAEGFTPERYKVFVHVIGDAYDASDDSNIWGQQDQEPRGGARPTTSWRPGEIIADDYLIPVQDDAPPGRYTIRVGMYLPLSNTRLPAFSDDGEALGDSIPIAEITIPD